MRCTQIMGLHTKAHSYLNENIAAELVKCSCPHCQAPHVEMRVRKIYSNAKMVGMFGDGPDLYKYKLKNNEWVYEFVQAAPWSSGPCIFLALQRDSGEPIQETLWSDEEIDNA